MGSTYWVVADMDAQRRFLYRTEGASAEIPIKSFKMLTELPSPNSDRVNHATWVRHSLLSSSNHRNYVVVVVEYTAYFWGQGTCSFTLPPPNQSPVSLHCLHVLLRAAQGHDGGCGAPRAAHTVPARA